GERAKHSNLAVIAVHLLALEQLNDPVDLGVVIRPVGEGKSALGDALLVTGRSAVVDPRHRGLRGPSVPVVTIHWPWWKRGERQSHDLALAQPGFRLAAWGLALLSGH